MQRVWKYCSLFVFTILVFAILIWGLPTVAYAQTSPQTATPQKLLVYTAFPDEVIGMGESVALPVKLHTDVAPQIVQLQVRDVPTGWTATLRGANRIIESAFVQPNVDAAVDLKLDPPADVKAGNYKFTVVAQGEGVNAELPIALTVKDRVPPSLAMSIDLPTMRGKPDTTFHYTVALKNEGDEDLQVNLGADAPNNLLVSFQLNGQDVTDLPVEANTTKQLTVQAKPLSDLSAGAYPITVHANGGDANADLQLSAEVAGQPTLSLTAPDGRLSGDAYAGQDTLIKLNLQNTGTAPARGVDLSANPPSGWAVDFDPKQVDELAPGQQLEVTAKVHPVDKAVAGDYMLTLRAQPADATAKSVDFRVTVLTSTLWGVVGVGLIAVAVGVVALAVGRFGRR
ncbi:MAG: NEW3 domain-containing protein [Caldilineaceae bacterium]